MARSPKIRVWLCSKEHSMESNMPSTSCRSSMGIKKEAMKYRAQDTVKLLEKHHSRIASCRAVWVHRDTYRVAHNLADWSKRNIPKGKQEIVLSAEDLLGFLKDMVKKDLMLKIEEEKAAGGGRAPEKEVAGQLEKAEDSSNEIQEEKFVGMILIHIFVEALELYGLIVGIILSSRAGQCRLTRTVDIKFLISTEYFISNFGSILNEHGGTGPLRLGILQGFPDA
ncbi:hypothetical protein OROHE_023114 [Orobanche hederae]